MGFSFSNSTTPPSVIHPKDDFLHYKKLEASISREFNLTNKQFESLFFENGKIWETKQWPFTLCHRDATIDTIKDMDFFSTLMKLNIKEIIQWEEREVRLPMNINWKRYKISNNDLQKRELLEKKEAEKNQKWRERSEWPIWFKLLLIAYLRSSAIINENFEICDYYALNNGWWVEFNMNTLFWEDYFKTQITNNDFSTLYNENIIIDINPKNTQDTRQVWPFTIFPPINFKIEWTDNLVNSKNTIIENQGNYYLPKDGIRWNIKTTIFDNHAYAVKKVYTNEYNEIFIILENPRNTKEKIHISLNELKTFCTFKKAQIDITKLLEDMLFESSPKHASDNTKKDLASNLASNNQN